MALVLGTNAGFVTVAPVNDPAGANFGISGRYLAIKDTSNVAAAKIVEIGWWCDNSTEESNYEVAIYTHNVGNDEPLDFVQVARTNAKGTGSGWIKVTGLNIAINPSTIYWIAVQLDATATATSTNYAISGGTRTSLSNPPAKTTLPDPWGTSSLEDEGWMYAIYAVWEEAAVGTNMQIQIGEAWKEVPAMQINIDDGGKVWKAVEGAQIVIDDGGKTWKTIF